MIGNRKIRGVVGAISVAAVLGAMPVAAARGHGTGADEVVARGRCDGGSTWALRLVEHRRWIGVAFRVDSDAVGEVWRVQLRHEGRPFFLDLRRSSDPDGFVGVRRPVRNTRGLDVVAAKAVNLETRERCVARAAI